MNKKEYIQDLITRLCLNEELKPGMSSGDTISFKAHREAEKLNDKKLIPILTEIILAEKAKDRRGEAYWILASLSGVVQSSEAASFLLHHIQKEKDKYLIMSTFDKLYWEKAPINTDLKILLKFAEDKRWQVKSAALNLIGIMEGHALQIEKVILGKLDTEKQEDSVKRYASVLFNKGGQKSIPYLINMTGEYKNTDIVSTAFQAIAKIDAPNYIDFFIEEYPKHRASLIKEILSAIIADNCKDERAIPLLIGRAKKILAKKRKRSVIYVGGTKPELVHIAEYLKVYKDTDKKVEKFFIWLKDKKWDFLDETEQDYFDFLVEKKIKEF